jgi:hypothetical protein
VRAWEREEGEDKGKECAAWEREGERIRREKGRG